GVGWVNPRSSTACISSGARAIFRKALGATGMECTVAPKLLSANSAGEKLPCTSKVSVMSCSHAPAATCVAALSSMVRKHQPSNDCQGHQALLALRSRGVKGDARRLPVQPSPSLSHIQGFPANVHARAPLAARFAMVLQALARLLRRIFIVGPARIPQARHGKGD